MVNTNQEWITISDRAIIQNIGTFIKHQRLNIHKTQAQLALEAGVNRWTVGQIENGEAITLLSLIQIMRALDILPLLEIFTVQNNPSPIELAKIQQSKKQRVRNPHESNPQTSDW